MSINYLNKSLVAICCAIASMCADAKGSEANDELSRQGNNYLSCIQSFPRQVSDFDPQETIADDTQDALTNMHQPTNLTSIVEIETDDPENKYKSISQEIQESCNRKCLRDSAVVGSVSAVVFVSVLIALRYLFKCFLGFC